MKLRSLLFLIAFLFLRCDFEQGPLLEATGAFERAVALYNERAYRQAETLFVQSLAVFEQHGETRSVSDANRYLGHIALVEGRPYTAFRRFRTALQFAREGRDFRSEMALHGHLGDAQVRLGRWYDASASYRAARQLSAAFNDLVLKATLERKLGKAAFLAGNLDGALAEYQSALAYVQSIGDNVEAAELLGEIGQIYSRQKRFPEALNSFSQARTLIGRLDQPVLDATLRMYTGVTLQAQRSLNDALQEYRDAANLLRTRRVGREYEVLMLFHIGTIYFEHQRYPDAKEYFQEGELLARTLGDRVAEAYHRYLTVLCDLQASSPTQRMQGKEAIASSFTQAAEKFRLAGQQLAEAMCHIELGKYSVSVGNPAQALELFRKAVAMHEATTGDYLDPELHLPYAEYLDVEQKRHVWPTYLAGLLMQAGRTEEALLVADRASSKVLFDLYQDVDVTLRHPDIKTEVTLARTQLYDLRLLQRELSSLLAYARKEIDGASLIALRGQIDRLRSEVSALARRVVVVHPNYEPLLQPSSLTLQELQAALPRGTLVLSFLIAQEQLHIFAIGRSRFEVKSTVIPRDKLLSMVSEYRRLLQDPSVYTGTGGEESVPAMTRFATLSSQLYDYFLRPVDSFLERNLVIIMSPDLDRFPFHTLERQERGGTVKYLVEITSVDFLPSLSSFRFRTANSPRITHIVALGNPTGKNWSIDYELRDIRSFFKDARILISLEASWENLAASKADVLQLSTEFYLMEGASPLGAFAVSDGKTQEESVRIPFERLSELPAFPVVVLSNQVGQGIGFSTPHAMLLRINGTSDVFLNAWHADRKAAKFFSEFFYTHLSNGLAPGDAFRQALLNLIRIKEVSHPHSWGQFFHFGVG
jgi:tetratricopeptide (TPR) repeat protein